MSSAFGYEARFEVSVCARVKGTNALGTTEYERRPVASSSTAFEQVGTGGAFELAVRLACSVIAGLHACDYRHAITGTIKGMQNYRLERNSAVHTTAPCTVTCRLPASTRKRGRYGRFGAIATPMLC